MSNEISVSPLVDVLTKQLNRVVVMSGDSYVYLDTKEVVAQAKIDLAVLSQNAEKTKAYEAYFTSEIQAHIDDAIAIFNETNGVAFESLANIDSAGNRDGYSLQIECKAFADWAYITVWDTMRAWQATLMEVPTEEEFRSKLATVAYNG